jgi:hypothetical protein
LTDVLGTQTKPEAQPAPMLPAPQNLREVPQVGVGWDAVPCGVQGLLDVTYAPIAGGLAMLNVLVKQLFVAAVAPVA